ncbi:hypothetical protein HPB52_013094 [Rhipicephalus sanguineus]|uniref:Uncharacterized protein n=1 Tax=Rhipicephalus sanguineus TaxID=34632 RepID=A0A9D4Q720_RHISA|nr:hypothetical protein HPB52_013094 [Rhipicephalus sanguineus]
MFVSPASPGGDSVISQDWCGIPRRRLHGLKKIHDFVVGKARRGRPRMRAQDMRHTHEAIPQKDGRPPGQPEQAQL